MGITLGDPENCCLSQARIREVLYARFHFADVLWRHKFIYTRTAEPQILEELATRCHFVVTAIGD
jgi:hypothetical protein